MWVLWFDNQPLGQGRTRVTSHAAYAFFGAKVHTFVHMAKFFSFLHPCFHASGTELVRQFFSNSTILLQLNTEILLKKCRRDSEGGPYRLGEKKYVAAGQFFCAENKIMCIFAA